MNRILVTFSAIALVALAFFGLKNYYTPVASVEMPTTERFAWEEEDDDELPKEVRIRESLAWNFEITKDEALGYPPTERLMSAVAQTKRLQEQYYGSNSQSREGLEDARWTERGPSNIGGRTRTVWIDLSDPDRNKIWAGGVSGGLWVTEDITADFPNWQKADDYLDNLSVGAVTQNPNNTDIMFMGTGEIYTGIRGAGIFRSTDGGDNWELLPNASDPNFGFTQGLVVHPVTNEVFAATNNGIYRSTNNGDTWLQVFSAGTGNNRTIYDLYYEAGNFFASNRNKVFRSPDGSEDSWTSISNGIPTNWQRLEFTICKSDPGTMYAVGNVNNLGTPVYGTNNGGLNWNMRGEVLPGGSFTNDQAWYDLDISVDPFNCNQVIAGGVPMFFSTNGGFSFNFTESGHVDHHYFLFDHEQQGRVIQGNDGGVYYREAGPGGPVQDKNNGYNVTQFYAGAIHPEAYSNYILGGTQDNNSLRMNSVGIATAQNVNGGDGMYCHIDQDDGMIQIVSSQFGNYVISDNGGQSFSGGVNVNGSFVNISDYDNDANVLYAQTNDGDLYRYRIGGNNSTPIVATGTQGAITNIFADPNVDDRIYIGCTGGRVYRIDNANTGAALQAVQLSELGGSITGIDVERGNPDHILITKGNYGVTNNIYESTDGGETWVGSEGVNIENNLPDIPVRWCVFNPDNADQAMIATELGVWGTENLDGDNTVWFPPVPGRGTPLVRTDMLQVRMSDKQVLAATYGRGMFTSGVWSAPKALLAVRRVGYAGGPIFFNGSASVNADSYLWDLGDGTTETQEDFFHSYDNIGQYPISLTINGDDTDPELNAEGMIKILPNLPVPYAVAESAAAYGGSFESNEEQWGVENVGGNSTWERGFSQQEFKFGTHTGDNAFIIAKDEEHYAENSETYLYMPNFDLSDRTIYSFSFYARYETAGGQDGFNVQYSTDKGQNWQVLGEVGNSWYNFANEDFTANTRFPFGEPFFTGTVAAYTNYSIDITELAGEPDVAFRFVFRSGVVPGEYAGVAIDDVQIKKFDGDPVTTIVEQSVEFDESVIPNELIINWSTRPEFYADKFEIYVSEDGQNFELRETVPAAGRVFAGTKNYSKRTDGRRNLYFVQIWAVSTNEDIGLADTLKAPIMVANKKPEEGTVVLADPNPFNQSMNLTFTDFVNGPVTFELFDVAGRLLNRETRMIEGVFTTYDAPNLATGLYLLRYTVGEEESKIFKIYKAEN